MSRRLPIIALHESIDEQVQPIEAKHRPRLRCKEGCSDCCVDEITVFEVEADRIREAYSELLATGSPHPSGRCAFIDDRGSCRIYDARPYVCRTQGLPLRWVDETEDGEWVEMRDICPLNEAGPPIETLDESDCWTLGPLEARMARLQEETTGGLERVPLRSLFVSETAK